VGEDKSRAVDWFHGPGCGGCGYPGLNFGMTSGVGVIACDSAGFGWAVVNVP
jgi:hypothetical protein